MNRDLQNVSKLRQSKLCVDDPISVSNQFYRRWQAMLRKVIMNPNGPVGEVEHFFWRIEYQARGAPHVHGKLWVKNAPVLGKDSDQAVMDFINKTVSCRLPPAAHSPILHGLVKTYQLHRCTASCLRPVKLAGNNQSEKIGMVHDWARLGHLNYCTLFVLVTLFLHYSSFPFLKSHNSIKKMHHNKVATAITW